MRIAVLTSSRADFGIYLPLLKKIREDVFFSLDIIAFGTHLSSFHGETINQIKEAGFVVAHRIESILLTDSAESIATSMGLTTIKFAQFWSKNCDTFDLVLCLGDRYEMFAAITSGIPFNIKFGHLHGGETTTGAIDNIFRHGITLASKYHFVSTTQYADKVAQLTGSTANIYSVGAMSLDNLNDIELLSIADFKNKWHIDLSKKTVLTTFHPETVNMHHNIYFTEQLIKVIKNDMRYQFLITMPNADTSGNVIRKMLTRELQDLDKVFLIENLGSQSYFSAMKYCSFLMGNTSSGIIEAATFGKYVINLGDRQQGRACGNNVLQVPIIAEEIQKAIESLSDIRDYQGENIYYKNDSSGSVIKILKEISSHAK